MEKLLEFLKEIQERIGWQAEVLMGLGVGLGLFTANVPMRLEGAGTFCDLLAWTIFSIGLVVALLKAFASYFKNRPARGVVDGLAAGLLAGLLGGALGWGLHQGAAYVTPVPERIAFCTLFALPVGSVLGLCFDLLHPDRSINWRLYLGGILIALISLFLLVSYGIAEFLPAVDGAGISLGDVELLFEFYALFMACQAAFAFAWSLRKLARQLPWLVAPLVLARMVTLGVPVEDRCQEPVSHRLAQMQFWVPDAGAACPNGYAVFPLAILAFMTCTSVAYAMFFLIGREIAGKPGQRDEPVVANAALRYVVDAGEDGESGG